MQHSSPAGRKTWARPETASIFSRHNSSPQVDLVFATQPESPPAHGGGSTMHKHAAESTPTKTSGSHVSSDDVTTFHPHHVIATSTPSLQSKSVTSFFERRFEAYNTDSSALDLSVGGGEGDAASATLDFSGISSSSSQLQNGGNVHSEGSLSHPHPGKIPEKGGNQEAVNPPGENTESPRNSPRQTWSVYLHDGVAAPGGVGGGRSGAGAAAVRSIIQAWRQKEERHLQGLGGHNKGATSGGSEELGGHGKWSVTQSSQLTSQNKTIAHEKPKTDEQIQLRGSKGQSSSTVYIAGKDKLAPKVQSKQDPSTFNGDDVFANLDTSPRDRTGGYSTHSLPHKRTLSSSIDQLNRIFDSAIIAQDGGLVINESEFDTPPSFIDDSPLSPTNADKVKVSTPSKGSLGYYKACATPQNSRKFPGGVAKKTVTFIDERSGRKVTPTRGRRDRSRESCEQRNNLFEGSSRGLSASPLTLFTDQSTPVSHPQSSGSQSSSSMGGYSASQQLSSARTSHTSRPVISAQQSGPVVHPMFRAMSRSSSAVTLPSKPPSGFIQRRASVEQMLGEGDMGREGDAEGREGGDELSIDQYNVRSNIGQIVGENELIRDNVSSNQDLNDSVDSGVVDDTHARNSPAHVSGAHAFIGNQGDESFRSSHTDSPVSIATRKKAMADLKIDIPDSKFRLHLTPRSPPPFVFGLGEEEGEEGEGLAGEPALTSSQEGNNDGESRSFQSVLQQWRLANQRQAVDHVPNRTNRKTDSSEAKPAKTGQDLNSSFSSSSSSDVRNVTSESGHARKRSVDLLVSNFNNVSDNASEKADLPASVKPTPVKSSPVDDNREDSRGAGLDLLTDKRLQLAGNQSRGGPAVNSDNVTSTGNRAQQISTSDQSDRGRSRAHARLAHETGSKHSTEANYSDSASHFEAKCEPSRFTFDDQIRLLDATHTSGFTRNQSDFHGNQSDFPSNQSDFPSNQSGFNSNQSGHPSNQPITSGHAFEVSPSLLNEFTENLNQSSSLARQRPSKDTASGTGPPSTPQSATEWSVTVDVRPMDKPIDEDIQFVQVQDKISMFEIKKPKRPKHLQDIMGAGVVGSTPTRRLPKPPTGRQASHDSPAARFKQKQDGGGSGGRCSPAAMTGSVSCYDLTNQNASSYRGRQASRDETTPYETRSLPRAHSRGRAGQTVTPEVKARSRSKTPNSRATAKNEEQHNGETNYGSLNRSAKPKPSVVASIVSKMNKSSAKPDQTGSDQFKSKSITSFSWTTEDSKTPETKESGFYSMSTFNFQNFETTKTEDNYKYNSPGSANYTNPDALRSSSGEGFYFGMDDTTDQSAASTGHSRPPTGISGTAASKIQRARRKMPRLPTEGSPSGGNSPRGGPVGGGDEVRNVEGYLSVSGGRRTPTSSLSPSSGRKTYDSSGNRSQTGRKTPDSIDSRSQSGRKTPDRLLSPKPWQKPPADSNPLSPRSQRRIYNPVMTSLTQSTGRKTSDWSSGRRTPDSTRSGRATPDSLVSEHSGAYNTGRFTPEPFSASRSVRKFSEGSLTSSRSKTPDPLLTAPKPYSGTSMYSSLPHSKVDRSNPPLSPTPVDPRPRSLSSGRRTPDFFLRERRLNSQSASTALSGPLAVAGECDVGGEPDVTSQRSTENLAVVGENRTLLDSTNSIASNSKSSFDAAERSTGYKSVIGGRRKLPSPLLSPSVSSSRDDVFDYRASPVHNHHDTSEGGRDINNSPKTPVMTSGDKMAANASARMSTRQFPDEPASFAARRQEQMARRVEKQQLKAQRLTGRLLPSTPATQAPPSGNMAASSGNVTTYRSVAEPTLSAGFQTRLVIDFKSEISDKSSSDATLHSDSKLDSSSSYDFYYTPSDEPHYATFPRKSSQSQQPTQKPSPPSRAGTNMASPSPSLSDNRARTSTSLSRERSRSPWQMALSGGHRGNSARPRQSMAALGRAIMRSVTPKSELLGDNREAVGDNREATWGNQASSVGSNLRSNMSKQASYLLRGRSEPSLVDAVETPQSSLNSTALLSPQSTTSSDLENNNTRNSNQTKFSNNGVNDNDPDRTYDEDNKSSSVSAQRSRRNKASQRSRRSTVGGVPNMQTVTGTNFPASRPLGSTVSERFMKLSQGDLQAPGKDTLEQLIRNPPRLSARVRRSSSMRDLSTAGTGAMFGGSELFERNKPVKVVHDAPNGLVGYVFSV